MHNGKTLWITLISLSLCAQAFGADPRKRKAVVDTQKAELCLEERCYPVLVGKDTPKARSTSTSSKPTGAATAAM